MQNKRSRIINRKTDFVEMGQEETGGRGGEGKAKRIKMCYVYELMMDIFIIY